MTKIKTTHSKREGALKVEPVDIKHRVKGNDIKKALKAAGVTQADLSEACGYASGARVSLLCKNKSTDLGGDAMAGLVKGLKSLGVDVSGYCTLGT